MKHASESERPPMSGKAVTSKLVGKEAGAKLAKKSAMLSLQREALNAENLSPGRAIKATMQSVVKQQSQQTKS